MQERITMSFKQSFSLSLFEKSRSSGKSAILWRGLICIARALSLCTDDEGCRKLLLNKLLRPSLQSGASLGDRSVINCGNCSTQVGSMNTIVANDKNKKLIVLPGPALDKWPSIHDNTALSALNKQLGGNYLESLLAKNKPREGETVLIDLPENTSNITKILVMPRDANKLKENTLQNLYLDASMKLKKEKKLGTKVYLFPPATGKEKTSNKTTGHDICNKMAGCLGADGMVTIVSYNQTATITGEKHGIQEQPNKETKQQEKEKLLTEQKGTETNRTGEKTDTKKNERKGRLDTTGIPARNRTVVQATKIDTSTTSTYNCDHFTLAMDKGGIFGYAMDKLETTQHGASYSLVNAANNHMRHGSGIAAVFKKKAGKEFKKHTKDMANENSYQDGDCMTCDPYEISKQYKNCHKIHNVIAPKNTGRSVSDAYKRDFKKTWINLFQAAEKTHDNDIVCCFIGCGIFGGNGALLAQSLHSALQDDQIKSIPKLPKLHIVGMDSTKFNDHRIYNDFLKEWDRLEKNNPIVTTRNAAKTKTTEPGATAPIPPVTPIQAVTQQTIPETEDIIQLAPLREGNLDIFGDEEYTNGELNKIQEKANKKMPGFSNIFTQITQIPKELENEKEPLTGKSLVSYKMGELYSYYDSSKKLQYLTLDSITKITKDNDGKFICPITNATINLNAKEE